MRKFKRYKPKSFGGRMHNKFVRFGVNWLRLNKSKKTVIIASIGGALLVVALVITFNFSGTPFKLGLPTSAMEGEQKLGEDAIAPLPTPTPTPQPTPDPTPTPTPDPTLKYGMENEEIPKLQARLMDLGYMDIDEPTKKFGPATEGAVMYFQRQHKLAEDGICGPKTLELIYSEEAKPYTLMEGTRGGDVDMLQSRLSELGYLSKSTGYYGTETVEAIKLFQKQNEIGVDGKTGQVTLSLMYSADAKPSPQAVISAARKGSIEEFIASAQKQVGKPYVWGAAGPKSFDCSGLITYCLREAGSSTGRLNARGFSKNSKWEEVSWDNLQRGDLMFFRARGTIGHVGIYIGNGEIIDASSANGKVVRRSSTSNWMRNNFINARRPW